MSGHNVRRIARKTPRSTGHDQSQCKRLKQRLDRLEKDIAPILAKHRALKKKAAQKKLSKAQKHRRWRTLLSTGIRKVGPGRYEIARKLVEMFTSNSSLTAKDAVIYPHSDKTGKPDGFVLRSIKPGGLLALMGFENGDVLNRVNGVNITGLDKVLEAYTKLNNVNKLTIGLTRLRKILTLTYVIK